ncbi:MAG: isoprenyl transferase [Candidatus Omnitrophica bacterium]|nr:isoprenyl transferase [Candidatus Omnitrophota bacterium]
MKIPRHIGIIMDGNGRWAKKRNLPKIFGHKAGGETVDRILQAAAKRGIQALTLYTFSTENWKRPKEEVDALMQFFGEKLRSEKERMKENNVRFNVIGRIHELSEKLQNEIKSVMDYTGDNTGITLSLAINYGGRQEIFDAAKELSRGVSQGKINIDELNESIFEDLLYTKGLPELDLIIRTSGEMRLSNFLLWQSAYAEIYVTDTLWPDFCENDLDKALAEFAGRNRRYGG